VPVTNLKFKRLEIIWRPVLLNWPSLFLKTKPLKRAKTSFFVVFVGCLFTVVPSLALLMTLVVAFVMTKFAMSLPQSGHWDIQHEYETILGAGSRVFIAALISYVISQAADLTVFSWIRKKTEGKHLWLRNNLSTVCGGGLDAIVFSTIAFYGVYPLGSIIFAAFVVRIAVSLLDTPLVYASVWFMNKTQNNMPKIVTV